MNDDSIATWPEAVARADKLGLLRPPDSRPAEPDDDQVREVVVLVDHVRDLVTHPNSWDEAYVPIRRHPDGRWLSVHTIHEHEIEILTAVESHSLDDETRLRVLELLAARTRGRAKVETYRKIIEHVAAKFAIRPLDYQVIFAIGRSFNIAPRFGQATVEAGDALERTIVARLLKTTDADEAVQLAQNLREQRRARSYAKQVAVHLRGIAETSPTSPWMRLIREEAASWHLTSGDHEAHYDDITAAVIILRDEATALLAEHKTASAARAAEDLELALDRLATIPRSARKARGIDQLHGELTRMIRQAGTATLSFMRPIRREIPVPEELPDLSELIEGKDLGTALQLFLHWLPITDSDAYKTEHQQLAERYPLTHVFPRVRLSRDGRKVARATSEKNDVTYGVPSHLWRAMVDGLVFRTNFYVTRFLAKSWMTLSAEHPLNIADFTLIARESSLVPSERESLVARGLHYGYGGDFLTAAHLLIPQLESIIRAKLKDAGVNTSAIEDGIETEKGLGALMTGEKVEKVFGRDYVFEIRALLCSPHGPNLRNELAHGLINDEHIDSVISFYAWWLIWRLVCSAFFNSDRDSEASDLGGPIVRGPEQDV